MFLDYEDTHGNRNYFKRTNVKASNNKVNLVSNYEDFFIKLFNWTTSWKYWNISWDLSTLFDKQCDLKVWKKDSHYKDNQNMNSSVIYFDIFTISTSDCGLKVRTLVSWDVLTVKSWIRRGNLGRLHYTGVVCAWNRCGSQNLNFLLEQLCFNLYWFILDRFSGVFLIVDRFEGVKKRFPL